MSEIIKTARNMLRLMNFPKLNYERTKPRGRRENIMRASQFRSALRCIGQTLQHLEIDAFKLKNDFRAHRDTFVGRAKTPAGESEGKKQ
jgi:hypothetical protein